VAEQPAPGVGTVLGSAGPCPEIPFGGSLWRVGHPTQRAKAALEELAAAKAVAEVRSLKAALPPDAYAEAFRELTAGLSAGEFRTWRPGWQRIVLGGGNESLLLLALLRENHPHATEADALALAAGEPELVAAALARVVPPFFGLLLEGVPLTPDQRRRATAAVADVAAKLAPPVPPPQPPTPPTT